MGRAAFSTDEFLAAARVLASKSGPATVTVESVTRHMKAPKGSFYYRFPSRDFLLAEVWLRSVQAYQEGFLAAIDAGDGLAAALHTPDWARKNVDEAALLLLYSREDFVQGVWPVSLRDGVRDQAKRFKAGLEQFSHQVFGGVGAEQMRLATFILAEVPLAAVKCHLKRREPPPPLVDKLIRVTYRAVIDEVARGGMHAVECDSTPD